MTKNLQKIKEPTTWIGFIFIQIKKDNLHVYIWKIIPSFLFHQNWYFNHRKPFEWVIFIISKEFKGRMQNSIICNSKSTFKCIAGSWFVSHLFRNRDVQKSVIKIESDVCQNSDSTIFMNVTCTLTRVSVTFNRFTPFS